MPSKSAAQHRYMEGIAHGMKPYGKGPSKAVALEFVRADQAQGKHFKGKKHKSNPRNMTHEDFENL